MKNKNLLVDLDYLKREGGNITQIALNVQEYIEHLEQKEDRLYLMEDKLDAINNGTLTGKEVFLEQFKEFYNE